MSHGRRVETGAGLKSKRVGGAGRWLAKTIISAEIVQYCIEQRLGSRTSSWHRPDTCMLHTDCHINTRKKPHIKRTGREVKPWSITVKFTLPQISASANCDNVHSLCEKMGLQELGFQEGSVIKSRTE